MEELKNKAALFALQKHNHEITYFSHLLETYKQNDNLDYSLWYFHYYEMELQLHRDSVEKIEQWIEKQKFEYE